jgi:uncharacterized phage protein gp47/JayE
MPYGVTSAGFIKKSLATIKQELEAEYRSVFGNINVAPESRFGQIIGTQAKRESDMWDQMELTYLAQYPNSASGVSLDNAVQYNGISRLPATSTLVDILLKGTNGSVIPVGTRISNGSTIICDSNVETTLDFNNTIESSLKVNQVQTNRTYAIQIDGYSYTYYSGASPTEAAILYQLSVNINAIHFNNVYARYDAENVELVIYQNDKKTPFAILVNTQDFSYQYVGTLCTFHCIDTGSIEIAPNTQTTIITPVAGLQSVTNPLDGIVGRNIESDTALRARRKKVIRGQGNSTVEAIVTRLTQEVPGVSLVNCAENTSNITDEFNRPPKSIEALVVGGLNQDIANALWKYKPAGIEAYGNTSAFVVDSQGFSHLIRFSRPVSTYVWVRFDLELDETNLFPENGEYEIKNNVLAYCLETFGIGKEIQMQKMYNPLYKTSGIDYATIYLAQTSAPSGIPPVYSSSNLQLSSIDTPKFDISRIVVNIV